MAPSSLSSPGFCAIAGSDEKAVFQSGAIYAHGVQAEPNPGSDRGESVAGDMDLTAQMFGFISRL